MGLHYPRPADLSDPDLSTLKCVTRRVQVPNNWVLGFWAIGMIVQVLGKYMIIRYLDP